MRVSILSLSVILASLAIASGGILLGVWIARRKRDAALRSHGKPALVMPLTAVSHVPRAPLVRDSVPMRRSPITALAVAERLAPADYHEIADETAAQLVTMTTGAVRHDAVAEMVQGQALRFHRPADRSLPFLRGHLLVLEGPDAGLELRFVRLAGGEQPVISFGRSEGPPFRHVQLLEPTVSRAHARLEFEEDGWSLVNLSRTNPVVVNRAALLDEHPVRLRDGDRIEMGTLAFRYLRQ